MTILEKLGATFGALVLVGFLGLETYFQYDYWFVTKPAIVQLQKVEVKPDPVIQRLNEVVAKTQDGKDLTRVDMYDMVSSEFIKAVKNNNQGAK